jgi:hypothetical protein
VSYSPISVRAKNLAIFHNKNQFWAILIRVGASIIIDLKFTFKAKKGGGVMHLAAMLE